VADPFAISEEYVFYTGNDANQYYRKYDIVADSFTTLQSFARPAVNTPVGSNGTFIFMQGSSGSRMGQWAWTGAALTNRYEASLTGGNKNQGFFCVRPDGGRTVVALKSMDFGQGIQSKRYQLAPAYSYTAAWSNGDANHNWDQVADFRVASPGTSGYGDTVVGLPTSNGGSTQSLTFSSGVGTAHSTITFAYGGGARRAGWDRDSGLIAIANGSGGTTLALYQLNMTTRALTSIGTSSALTGTGYAAACVKGFIVVVESANNLRSYTRSGTTLTLVNTLASPFGGSSNTAASMTVSPFSNLIYAHNGNGNGFVFSISDAGVLTKKASIAQSNTRLMNQVFTFIGTTALPTV